MLCAQRCGGNKSRGAELPTAVLLCPFGACQGSKDVTAKAASDTKRRRLIELALACAPTGPPLLSGWVTVFLISSLVSRFPEVRRNSPCMLLSWQAAHDNLRP